MKHKWTDAEHAYFTKPIPKAKPIDYDWIWWVFIGVISCSGILYLLIK